MRTSQKTLEPIARTEVERQAIISSVALKTMTFSTAAMLDGGRFTFPRRVCRNREEFSLTTSVVGRYCCKSILSIPSRNIDSRSRTNA
jgi:hypothetical protein